MHLIFKRKEAENLSKLNEEAAVFGLTFLCDSATVKKMPLINTIKLSENISPVVLDIHNLSEHLAAGGNKDAPYIADVFLRHLIVINKKRNITDIIYFDGVLNVQKAGNMVGSNFTQVICLNEAEHFFALFFTDLSKMKDIRVS